MRLALHYGRGLLPLEIPQGNILAFRQPRWASTVDNQKILLDAINEFGILRLSPIFTGRQVGVIIEDDYTPYSHKAYKFAQMIQQLGAIHVHSSLPDEAIARIHLTPCADPQALMNRWLAKNPQAKMNIFDGANKLAIYAE